AAAPPAPAVAPAPPVPPAETPPAPFPALPPAPVPAPPPAPVPDPPVPDSPLLPPAQPDPIRTTAAAMRRKRAPVMPMSVPAPPIRSWIVARRVEERVDQRHLGGGVDRLRERLDAGCVRDARRRAGRNRERRRVLVVPDREAERRAQALEQR